VSTAEVAVPGSRAYLREARKAKWLSWASLAYMALEGIVAVVAGIVAGSIALIGFGLDSAIEGFASVVIVWRFTGTRTLSERAEHRAQKLVAVQFFILAPYLGVESLRALIDGSHAEVSVMGIALAASSLVLMPLLGQAKQRIGSRIGSSATASEGKQNLLCAYLAAALLVGLLGNALFRRVVARPGRRTPDRGRCGPRRPRGVARRRLRSLTGHAHCDIAYSRSPAVTSPR
jgi:divalent metal cation (Fe/Co/Zn/Cd) transporter